MSATYSLGRSPKSLTSCPFVALYTAWEKASQVVPLYSCMSATYSLVQSPTCLTSCLFVALYVGNLQPWEVPKIPQSCPFVALYVGNLQPWEVPKIPHKLSLCSPVCRQPTALGGPQNPSQVVQPAMPWVVPLEMPSLALPLGMLPWSSQPQGSRKGDVNQKQQVCKRVDSERFQMSNVASSLAFGSSSSPSSSSIISSSSSSGADINWSAPKLDNATEKYVVNNGWTQEKSLSPVGQVGLLKLALRPMLIASHILGLV